MEVEVLHLDCYHAQIKSDLAKHSYRWVTMLSHRPSLSLAVYEPNQYVVGVFQHHNTTLEHSGVTDHWKNIKSNYCLQRYDYFVVGAFHYLVTDPVVGGPVTAELEQGDDSGWTIKLVSREDRVRDLAYHLLRALFDIHCEGFAHLNLQWSNVWLDRNLHALLGGFHNLTPLARPEEAILGHPLFTPPEMLALHDPDCRSPETAPDAHGLIKVDMWALGVCVLEALTGCWVGSRSYLTRGATVAARLLLQDIQQHLPLLPERLSTRDVGEDATDFVVQLLQMDPGSRPTAEEALRHPWITSRCVVPIDCCCLPDGVDVGNLTTCSVIDLVEASTDPASGKLIHTRVKVPKGYGSLARLLRGFGYQLEEVAHRDQRGTWILRAKTMRGGIMVGIKRKLKRRSTRGERYHWPTLRNCRVLEVLDAFQAGPYLYFVTQWMDLGDVQTAITKGPDKGELDREAYFREATIQVLHALKYLHERGLAHLNITWQHVLKDSNGSTKLTGFENMRGIRGQGTLRFGYLPLRAPESFRRGDAIRANLPKMDMWSLGASLLRGLTGKSIAGQDFRSAYNFTNPDVTYRRILDNLAQLPSVLSKTRLSSDAQIFIMRLLHFRPDMRPTAEASLQDQWVEPPIKATDCDMEAGLARITIATEKGASTPPPPSHGLAHKKKKLIITTETEGQRVTRLVGGKEISTITPTIQPEVKAINQSPRYIPARTPQRMRPSSPDATAQTRRLTGSWQQSSPQYLQQQPPPPPAQPTYSNSDTMSQLMAEHMWKTGPRVVHPLPALTGRSCSPNAVCHQTCECKPCRISPGSSPARHRRHCDPQCNCHQPVQQQDCQPRRKTPVPELGCDPCSEPPRKKTREPDRKVPVQDLVPQPQTKKVCEQLCETMAQQYTVVDVHSAAVQPPPRKRDTVIQKITEPPCGVPEASVCSPNVLCVPEVVQEDPCVIAEILSEAVGGIEVQKKHPGQLREWVESTGWSPERQIQPEQRPTVRRVVAQPSGLPRYQYQVPKSPLSSRRRPPLTEQVCCLPRSPPSPKARQHLAANCQVIERVEPEPAQLLRHVRRPYPTRHDPTAKRPSQQSGSSSERK